MRATQQTAGHDVSVMNALIIGGAGFIGSHLVDRLLAEGQTVDVVDDLTLGSLANLSDARAVGGRLKIHNLSASSNEVASLLGMRRPDVVYHLAAIPRVDVTPASLAAAFSTTVALLEAARVHNVAKIVVALPATALYGRPASKELPIKERPLEPRGVRGVVAHATIDLLATYRDQSALEYTVLALSSVYGSRQRAPGGVVAAFRQAVDDRTAPTITGDGRQTRDFLFIDDAVDALVRAAGKGGGLTINVGTGVQTSIRSLWDAMPGSTGMQPRLTEVLPDEIQRFALSPVRARIQLAWSPWTALADGLTQLR